MIVKHLLVRKLGCEVVECVNGVEGLSAMAKEHVDLAIVDVNMPELNGIDFVEAVRDSPTLKDVCIVMLTSDRREEVVRQLLAMGVAGYIVKPLVPDVVLAKLEPILKSIVPAGSVLAGPLPTGI